MAEKPSIAREVTRIISRGPNRTEPSPSRFNPNFVFEAEFLGQRALIVVTSVVGHIRGIDFPSEYRRWDSVDPGYLLDRVDVLETDEPDRKEVIANLESQASRSTDLFLWLDCDREGEAIAFEVATVCSRGGRNLRVHRAKFSSLVRAEVAGAFARPVRLDAALAAAVDCRREVDLRTGAAFTRMQTQLLARDAGGGMVSYGPCQFPTLALVVERFLRRIRHRSVRCWTIQLELKVGTKKFDAVWERKRLFDKFTVAMLLEKAAIATLNADEDERGDPSEARERNARGNGPFGRAVVEIGARTPETRRKPLPLTTVELQKLATSRLRMSAAEAMKAAETLYTQGYISYPRTETDGFPRGFSFDAVLSALAEGAAAPYSETAARLLQAKKARKDQNDMDQEPQEEARVNACPFEPPRSGGRSDQAHPPIHPVSSFRGAANSSEAKIFDLVTRRFLAACSRDAKLEASEYRLNVGGERFLAKGVRVVESNFLEIYRPYYSVRETELPVLRPGQRVEISFFGLQEGSTEPPRLITEPELIGLMDRLGIGTDATIAEHIKTILERKFAVKTGGVFRPTQLGFALIGAYQLLNLPLIHPHKRAETEVLYTKVAQSGVTKDQALRVIMQEMIGVFRVLKDSQEEFLRQFKRLYEAYRRLEVEEPAHSPPRRREGGRRGGRMGGNGGDDDNGGDEGDGGHEGGGGGEGGAPMRPQHRQNKKARAPRSKSPRPGTQSQPKKPKKPKTKRNATPQGLNPEPLYPQPLNPPTPGSMPSCLSCGRPTKALTSKTGSLFLGCTGYPQCSRVLFFKQRTSSISEAENCHCGSAGWQLIFASGQTRSVCASRECRDSFWDFVQEPAAEERADDREANRNHRGNSGNVMRRR